VLNELHRPVPRAAVEEPLILPGRAKVPGHREDSQICGSPRDTREPPGMAPTWGRRTPGGFT
jgi:hypothetical protein